MLSKNTIIQNKVIITTLEDLMPKEHFLRDLNKLVDFSFIYEKVGHLYSQVGRPSVDPVVLIKSLLLGFIYGIDSERKIEREIQVNIAYRWFLGIDLDEKVPDHSTISQTRHRKFNNTSLFEDIFVQIVKKCIEVGLVDGSLILTDSTHVKANASSSSKRKEYVTVTIEPSDYVKKLDKICEEEDLIIRAEAIKKGYKKRGFKAKVGPKTKTIIQSTTDPDSGMMKRPGKPEGFHYLSHQSTCGKSGIITDVHVTPANINDYTPYVGRIKHQIEKYGFEIKEVGLDKGYDRTEVHKELYDLGIKTFTPLVQEKSNITVFQSSAFKYNLNQDIFICPNNCELKLASISKTIHCRVYAAKRKHCLKCTLKTQCKSDNLPNRVLKIPLFQFEADIQRANYGTPRYYDIQRLRKIYCEGNFALQKDNHNLRSTRKRGNKNVAEHCLLSALALNLKRLVKYMKNNPNFTKIKEIFHFILAIKALFILNLQLKHKNGV